MGKGLSIRMKENVHERRLPEIKSYRIPEIKSYRTN